MYQVKPSIQEAMYDLPEEKKTWEGFVECLRMCDAFPSNYRDDYLDKHDDPQTKMAIMMALLGMIDPRKPSQKIENKRKQKKEFSRNPKFDKDYEKEKPTEIKAEEGNESKNSGNYYKNREWKDRRTSSNNPLPKSPAFSIQERPTKSNYQFKPEAKARSKSGNTPEVTTEVLYDSGSKINVIHSELAKKLGLKVTNDPSMYRTVGGNTTIPFVTEEFHVKLKLVEKETGKIKWYPYNITCRVADIVPNTILLGSRFTDSHLIYRGIDEKDKKVKVFKVGGETERPEEDGMDVGIIGDIYVIFEATEDKKGKGNDKKKERIDSDNVGKIKMLKGNPSSNPKKIYKIEPKLSKCRGFTNPMEMLIPLHPVQPTSYITTDEAIGEIQNEEKGKVKQCMRKLQQVYAVQSEKKAGSKEVQKDFNESTVEVFHEHNEYGRKLNSETGTKAQKGPINSTNSNESETIKEFNSQTTGQTNSLYITEMVNYIEFNLANLKYMLEKFKLVGIGPQHNSCLDINKLPFMTMYPELIDKRVMAMNYLRNFESIVTNDSWLTSTTNP